MKAVIAKKDGVNSEEKEDGDERGVELSAVLSPYCAVLPKSDHCQNQDERIVQLCGGAEELDGYRPNLSRCALQVKLNA